MAEKENRTGDIALGLLGATGTTLAGWRGANASSGKPWAVTEPASPSSRRSCSQG